VRNFGCVVATVGMVAAYLFLVYLDVTLVT
jgi:hypothetical protein